MSSQTLKKPVSVQPGPAGASYSKVMLIDDNSLDNFINKKLLESNGFAEDVSSFQLATEAIEFLSKAPVSELPEVIFLDIMMPVMDGFQFLDEFGKLPEFVQRHCKVILLSTSESFKDLNRANKNKFVRKFLNKPLTAQVIQAIHV